MRQSTRRKLVSLAAPLAAIPLAALVMMDETSGKIALSIFLIVSIASPPITLWLQQREVAAVETSKRYTSALELNPRTEVSPNFKGWQGTCKRVIDIVFSFTVLVLILPIFFLIALAVRLGDSGPIFYRIEYPGKHRRQFIQVRFRTIKVDLDPEASLTHSGSRTQMGRFLERINLHKIPILLNVLKGDMSLIGPEPQSRSDLYRRTGWTTILLEVRPGLISLANVMAGARQKALIREHQILWDIFYVNHWSLTMDAKISWWAIKSALLGRGDPPNAGSLRATDENTAGEPAPAV